MTLKKIMGVPADIAAALPADVVDSAVARILARQDEVKRRHRRPPMKSMEGKKVNRWVRRAVRKVRRYQHVLDVLDWCIDGHRKSPAGCKATVPLFAMYVGLQMNADYAGHRGMLTDAVGALNSLSTKQRESIGLTDWRTKPEDWWAMYCRLHRLKWKVLDALDAGLVVNVNGTDIAVNRNWYMSELARGGRRKGRARTKAAAGDSTDAVTAAKRRRTNVGAPEGKDGRPRPTVDPDARPGYRTKTLKRPYHDYLGFSLSVLVEVPEGTSGEYHPGYLISVSVEPANPNHNQVMLGMHDDAERAGYEINEVTIDRGYYGAPLTRGLLDRDVRLNMALKEDDEVWHGGQPGVLFIGHVPYDDRMPESWRNVRAPHFTAPVIERARYEVFCDLRWERYGYRRMTNPDAEGRVRWRSPIGNKRAWSPSLPHTHHLSGKVPKILLAAGEKPKLTTRTRHDELPMRQQYVPYGHKHAAATAHRSAAERVNSLLKTWYCRGMNHGEWHAVHGATNFAFFVGPALCGMNDHLGSIDRWRIDVGLDPGEDPDEAPASGDPPAARAA